MEIDVLAGVDRLLHRTVGRWQICPLWVLRGEMFTIAEKALLIALFDVWHSAGRPQWFWVTRKELAHLMGASEETCRVARNGLVDKCIIKLRRGRQHTASHYQFSQDFLYTLFEEQKDSTTLKTSTYSNSKDSSGLDLTAADQTARF